MSDDKPQKVRVEVLQDHTTFGKAYKVGDVYEVDEDFVENLRVQGKAKRADEPAAKPMKPVKHPTTDDK